MSESVWSHKPAWPKDRQVSSPQRSVLMDDVCVGTVIFVSMGARGPVWTWSTLWWSVVPIDRRVASRGAEATLEAALEAVRSSHLKIMEQYPDVNERLVEQAEKVAATRRFYEEKRWLHNQVR